MDEGEQIAISTYTNGPLTMHLEERIEEDTWGWRPGDEIMSLEIIDTEHGLSESKYITEVNYLKQVLEILDQDRKEERLKSINEHFSKTPDSDGNHLHGDQ